MNQPSENHRGRQLRRRRAIALLAVVAIAAGASYVLLRPEAGDIVSQGRRHFDSGEYERALELAEIALERVPDDPAALVLAGDASFAREEFDRALAFYRRVPNGSSKESIHARFRCGRIEFHHIGDTARAEESFRAGLKHDPDNRNGLFQLASLLGIQARRREAIPFVLRLFRQGAFNHDFLGLLGAENSALFNLKELRRYERATPDHPGVLVGLARHARSSRKFAEVDRLLKRAIASKPTIDEAWVALATLLWDTKQFQRLRTLLADERVRRIEDSRLWLVRGQLAERDGQSRSAARCFWEAWRRNPTDRSAAYQLYRHLNQSGHGEHARGLQQLLAKLQVLRERSDVVDSTTHSTSDPIRLLVEQLESVDRLWEAWGRCFVAKRSFPDADWAVERERVLRKKLQSAPLRVVCQEGPALPIDLSRYPLPQFASSSKPQSTKIRSTGELSFRDDATAAGIRFQYFNSPAPAGKGQRMFEFNGGGCGVGDFDRDGWPDLYFTQGCRWPVNQNRHEHLDRLFRNLGNGRFADVTVSAGIRENRFSTGMAVGDFNNDGFPDLYVANIGRNRLFQNNGDGTFRDVTATAGVDDPRWSTSCVMSDLNGDSLPDIYSVNYLTGDDVFKRICRHKDGHPRMCMPFHFPGAQDQFYLNLGDGRFANVTKTSGITMPNGKGLGVVAANWNGNGRLGLFVANDTVANFLFVNEGPDERGRPRFAERGLASGVAVNRDGRAEGCMGIAVGDANDDGSLDLYVTNFLNESNTLYIGKRGGVFEDATRRAGLDAPSRKLLGFGTQFIDADNDGRLDLLVANGHIDDYRRYGRPYKMPAQFYSNIGRGRFAERSAERLGPYFRKQLLGRGMSRLDWNRDGREDAVVSHLDAPAALLTNTTESAGRSLSLRLRGVRSSRDAIGTTVIVRTEHRSMMRQLTAGDGYQASNERVLSFGLARAGTIQRIIVQWPTGKRDEFIHIEPNRRYVAIEQSGALLRLP